MATDKIVMWETRLSIVDGFFQDSDFAGDLEDSESTSGGVLFIFGMRTFVTISWMCKQQTSVSHSSTESVFFWLDACLMMGGLPALDLWDVVIEVFHISKLPEWRILDVDQLPKVDYVVTNANSSQGESQLYIFEDNEAVIKMIIKGRSPTMRHVSRTHRVALDWSFDRTNLDPKIQFKFVDTRSQLADTIITRSFTRDEWDHLLRLLNINFSMFSCRKVRLEKVRQWRNRDR